MLLSDQHRSRCRNHGSFDSSTSFESRTGQGSHSIDARSWLVTAECASTTTAHERVEQSTMCSRALEEARTHGRTSSRVARSATRPKTINSSQNSDGHCGRSPQLHPGRSGLFSGSRTENGISTYSLCIDSVYERIFTLFQKHSMAVSVRMSPQQYADIQQHAIAAGLTISEFMLRVVSLAVLAAETPRSNT